MATPLGDTGKKRRRTEIAPIDRSKPRMVCFSKRSRTLSTKAIDLHNLLADPAGKPACPPGVAIVAFTIAGKPFAVGLPSLDPILDDYLTQFGDGDGDHKRRRTDLRAATEAEMDEMDERLRVMASKWDEELQAKEEQLTQDLRSLETTASPIFDGDSAPVVISEEEAWAVGDAVTPVPCSCEDDHARDFVDSVLVDDTDDDNEGWAVVGDAVTPAPRNDHDWDIVDSLFDDTTDDSCSAFDLCSQVEYSVWKDVLLNGDHGDLLM